MTTIERYQEHGLDLACRFEDGRAWVTVAQLAELFGVSRQNVDQHVRNILKEAELPDSVCKDFLQTASDGKSYQTRHVNQDMALHVGYRVRSERGSEFRRWATAIVRGEAPALAARATDPILATLEVVAELRRAQLDQGARLESVERALEQHQIQAEGFGYFTVLGWAKERGVKIDHQAAARVGKAAASHCRSQGWVIGKTRDPYFGSVNTYPAEAIEAAWQRMQRAS